MAQAVSLQRFFTEVQDQSQCGLCGIYGGKVALG
jgi:hypothetical protein